VVKYNNMTDYITQEKAIQMALNEAARKHAKGHLYRPGEDENHDWGNGDPETIYSIASCYTQFTEDYDAAQAAIGDALAEKYGDNYR
jgi:hypothetical protein